MMAEIGESTIPITSRKPISRARMTERFIRDADDEDATTIRATPR